MTLKVVAVKFTVLSMKFENVQLKRLIVCPYHFIFRKEKKCVGKKMDAQTHLEILKEYGVPSPIDLRE